MTLVLPSTLPLPLLSSVLDALFVRLSAPSVSLVSSAASTTLAAGVRSALVVDVGWHEAVVTAVYEFREVSAGPVRTSVRAGRMLVRKVRAMLDAKAREEWTRRGGEGGAPTFGFEECEEVATRLVWCRRRADGADEKDEQDDLESSTTPIEIPGPAGSPPGFAIRIPFNGLSEPCEATFFGSSTSGASRIFDDHELPLHLLVYRALLQLPVDVRAVCMSRIIFVGGCARILGLRARVMNEVMRLAERHQWDPVTGKGYDKVKANPRLKRGSGSGINGGNQAHQPDGNGAAFAEQEPDEIEERILRTNSGGNKSQAEPPVKGVLRCIDSLGPWAGASLLTPLKIPTLAQVERDAWLQHGAAGASRPADVDIRTQQRQSMGPTGLIRGTASGAGGAASGANWTLGVWGTQA